MIPDDCVAGVNLGPDGRSQFRLGPHPLRLDHVPEAVVARPGLAGAAVSLPGRRCKPKGCPPVVCAGGVRDHIQLYLSLPPDRSIASLVNALKQTPLAGEASQGGGVSAGA